MTRPLRSHLPETVGGAEGMEDDARPDRDEAGGTGRDWLRGLLIL